MVLTDQEIWTREVAEIRKRMTHCRHLPVQDANDSGLSLVEDQIVNLVVTMNQGASVPRLRRLVREEVYNVLEMRQFTDRNLGVHVHCLCLCMGDL